MWPTVLQSIELAAGAFVATRGRLAICIELRFAVNLGNY